MSDEPKVAPLADGVDRALRAMASGAWTMLLLEVGDTGASIKLTPEVAQEIASKAGYVKDPVRVWDNNKGEYVAPSKCDHNWVKSGNDLVMWVCSECKEARPGDKPGFTKPKD